MDTLHIFFPNSLVPCKVGIIICSSKMSTPRPTVYLTCPKLYSDQEKNQDIVPGLTLWSPWPIHSTIPLLRKGWASIFLPTENYLTVKRRAPWLPKPPFSRVCSMACQIWEILCEKSVLQTGELKKQRIPSGSQWTFKKALWTIWPWDICSTCICYFKEHWRKCCLLSLKYLCLDAY